MSDHKSLISFLVNRLKTLSTCFLWEISRRIYHLICQSFNTSRRVIFTLLQSCFWHLSKKSTAQTRTWQSNSKMSKIGLQSDDTNWRSSTKMEKSCFWQATSKTCCWKRNITWPIVSTALISTWHVKNSYLTRACPTAWAWNRFIKIHFEFFLTRVVPSFRFNMTRVEIFANISGTHWFSLN